MQTLNSRCELYGRSDLNFSIYPNVSSFKLIPRMLLEHVLTFNYEGFGVASYLADCDTCGVCTDAQNRKTLSD